MDNNKPDEPADDNGRTEFAEWARSIRALLDFVEAHDELFDLATVWGGPTGDVSIGCWGDDPAAQFAAVARIMGRADKVGDNHDLRLERNFGSDRFGPKLIAVVHREQVCERVEVGIETVEVPDPSAKVPTVTVTRPVFEWRCAPILAGAGVETGAS